MPQTGKPKALQHTELPDPFIFRQTVSEQRQTPPDNFLFQSLFFERAEHQISIARACFILQHTVVPHV